MKKYLNPNLKKYYCDALEEAKKVGGFWGLDPDVESYLTTINKSKNIQTVMSKRGMDFAKHYFHSYLTIAFTVEVERKLFNEIKPDLEKRLGIKIWEVSPHIQEPNVSTSGDPNYYNISVIRFDLKSKTKSEDKRFWDELQRILAEL